MGSVLKYCDFDLSLSSKQLEDKYQRSVIGMFDSEEKKLYVANDLSEEDRNSTAIHELIEAINYFESLGLTHHWKVEKLERALYSLLREMSFEFDRLFT